MNKFLNLQSARADLDFRLNQSGGTGQGLPDGPRTFMESRFGADLGEISLHTDKDAAQMNKELNAEAFTYGTNIYFGQGKYNPYTSSGKRLLAHELTHVIQQTNTPTRGTVSSSHDKPLNSIKQTPTFYIARQCEPAWATLLWSQRVTNAQGMPSGAARNQCFTDLIDEALYPNVTVHQSTNTYPTVHAAVVGGAYTEMGTFSSVQVNFDANLNAKPGVQNSYGRNTHFVPAGSNSLQLYIILGPRALNPIGPQFTQMAYDHEAEHASKRLLDWALNRPLSLSGTEAAAEDLEIYTENFIHYFLDMWTFDNSPPCSFNLAEDFRSIFTYYPQADIDSQNSAFENIEEFYNLRIAGIPCNLLKFKIWLQSIQNIRPAADLLVNRINQLPGLGLIRGNNPNTHLQCPTPCT